MGLPVLFCTVASPVRGAPAGTAIWSRVMVTVAVPDEPFDEDPAGWVAEPGEESLDEDPQAAAEEPKIAHITNVERRPSRMAFRRYALPLSSALPMAPWSSSIAHIVPYCALASHKDGVAPRPRFGMEIGAGRRLPGGAHETSSGSEGTLEGVAEPPGSALESIVEELDEDLSDPESATSLLFEADPARGLVLATAGLTERESFADLLEDPGLGRVRLVESPASRGTPAWRCSCGAWGNLGEGLSVEEAAQTHLAEHLRE
jgi:hypothetical protein